MSKYLKDLISQDLSRRLQGVDDALVVNVVGLDANKTVELRKRLREKDIHLLVVKNSLARRATAGTQLASAFEGLDGPAAVVWGSEDFISLAKEIARLDSDKEFEQFEARGGVMEGDPLDADRVREISKWPNRAEQLSILLGQILSPGSTISGQLLEPGKALASQVKQIADKEEESTEESTEGSTEESTPES